MGDLNGLFKQTSKTQALLSESLQSQSGPSKVDSKLPAKRKVERSSLIYGRTTHVIYSMHN